MLWLFSSFLWEWARSDFHSIPVWLPLGLKLYILYNIGTTVPLLDLYMLHICFLCLSVSMFLVCSIGLWAVKFWALLAVVIFYMQSYIMWEQGLKFFIAGRWPFFPVRCCARFQEVLLELAKEDGSPKISSPTGLITNDTFLRGSTASCNMEILLQCIVLPVVFYYYKVWAMPDTTL